MVDNATPSANSLGADVLQRLALLTGDEVLMRRARSILRAVAPALERQPSAFGRMLSAADRSLAAPIDVVVAGVADSTTSRALREAAVQPFVPDLVLSSVAAGDPHADWPLHAGKVARHADATGYACRGYTCDEPTSDPDRLAAQAGSLAGRPD